MRWAVVFLLVLGVALSPTDARGDRDSEAKSLFEAAIKHHQAGEHEAALQKYRAAYDVVPRAKILLNIGAILADMDREAELANIYSDYVEHPQRDPAKAEEVKKLLASLDNKLGILEIVVSNATLVKVDGRVIGAGNISRRIRVQPGRHVVVARLRADSRREVVNIAAGQELAVGLSEPETSDSSEVLPPSTIERPAPEAPKERSSFATPYIWTGAATVAAAATGIVFGVRAKNAFDELDAINQDSLNTDYSVAKNARDRMNSNALIANVSFAAAGALGLTTGVLIALDLMSDDPATTASVAPTHGGAMMTMSRRF